MSGITSSAMALIWFAPETAAGKPLPE